jgi:phosphatidylinositol alpha-mannosyltransferase
MRIAIVCPYSCTMPGGVQTQVLGLARSLQSRGDDVAIVAPAEDSGMTSRLEAAALGGAVFVKVGGATAISVNGSRAPVSPWPTTMWRTVSALRAFGPEVVHVRSCRARRSHLSWPGRARSSQRFIAREPTSPTGPTGT